MPDTMTMRRERNDNEEEGRDCRSAAAPAASALLIVGLALSMLAGCTSAAPKPPPSVGTSVPPSPSSSGSPASTGKVPAPAHTLVVVMENHSASEVIGSSEAPYVNMLARQGALFTRSFAITHPSEPNYLALFSGSTQSVTGDDCPVTFSAPNLASGLLGAGKTFAGYAEDLPATGSQVCTAGEYARKHVPWADFSNIPGRVSLPYTRFPASSLASLPTVSFVIPNLCHDMHDCSAATGDAWLRTHISGYVTWAMSHNSLLILTWDENDGSPGNQIPTIFVGPMVKPGHYSEQITHYRVLATIEAAYGLPHDGHAASVQPITDIWKH